MDIPDIRLEDKTFEVYLSQKDIKALISRLATDLNAVYTAVKEEVVLISILDGSFIFVADIIRELSFPHKLQFVKLKSYEGMNSSGLVEQILGLQTDISGKHIIILEDIVDTGLTIESFIAQLKTEKPLSIKICTLLSKPDVHNDIVHLDYVGKEIPPEFVIGYGLDLNGYARNLPHIYKLKV